MDDYVFRVVSDDDTHVYRLYVEFIERGFNVIVFKNICAWQAHVDHRELKILADELELNESNYHENICGLFKNAPDVLFKLNNSEFVIYKELENSIKIKYFQCKLNEVNFIDNVYRIMDKFYHDKVQVNDRLETTNKEKENLKQLNSEYTANLNEFITRKNADDTDLLNKFVTILNEKKRRIQHLTELLETHNNNATIGTSGKGKSKLKAVSSSSDTDTEGEEPENHVPLKKLKLDELPSTSQQSTSRGTRKVK